MNPKNRNWKKLKSLTFIFNLFLVTILFLVFEKVGLFTQVNNLIYDHHISFANSNRKPHKDVVILMVDEASIKSLQGIVGRWPWDRQVWGELVDFLKVDGHAKNIFFDILFTEYTEPPKKRILEKNDSFLVDATRESGNVFHASHFVQDSKDDKNQNLLNRPLPKKMEPHLIPINPVLSSFNTFYLPFPELLEVSAGVGAVTFTADNDGIYRKTSLIKTYNEKAIPILPISSYLKGSRVHLQKDIISFDEKVIPLKDYKFFVNLNPNIETISLSGVFRTIQQIAQGETEDFFINPERFKNKEVFIGVSAAAAHDIKRTSFGLLPGVYLHASILNSILLDEYITVSGNALIFMILLLLASILNFLILYSKSSYKTIIVANSVLAVLYIFSLIYFQITLTWFDTGKILIILFFTSFISSIYRVFYEDRDKNFLKSAFKNYISPELIDIMHESGEPPKLGGEVGIRTAMFTDIANFSTFSEELEPTQLVSLLNEYLTEMTDILLGHGGTLDKFVGDAIIAFFGAPKFQEDHAIRAAYTALEMQERLQQLTKKWKEKYPDLPQDLLNMKVRIGLNSGEILTGNMGAKDRLNYTMMGDEVNLASRLESSAKQYGVSIHVSEKIYELIKDKFILRKLDRVIVKGRKTPVQTYELISTKDNQEKYSDLVSSFEEGLEYFYEKELSLAKISFKSSLEKELVKGDVNPSMIFLNRCQDLEENNPPADWDGIYRLEEK